MLSEIIESTTVDLRGWQLREPLGISDDGHVLFGAATCGGAPAVYRWLLPD